MLFFGILVVPSCDLPILPDADSITVSKGGDSIAIGFSYPDHVIGWRTLADTIDQPLSHWRYIKDIRILPKAVQDSTIDFRFRIWDFWAGGFLGWSNTGSARLIYESSDVRKYWFDIGTGFSGDPLYVNLNDVLTTWNSGGACDDCFFAQITTWPNNGLEDSIRFDFGQVGNYYTYLWPEPWWIDTGQTHYFQATINP
jgi:hypothetical protein